MGDPGPSTMASRRLPIPPKVSQVDADDLDEALVGMLGERIERSLGNLRVSSFPLKLSCCLLIGREESRTISSQRYLCY